MARIVVRRLLYFAPLLAIVSVLTFSLTFMVPGDPAVTLAGENPSDEQIDAIRERLNLDEPLLQQFGHWANDALHGDLGDSLFLHLPVVDIIRQRLPVTLSLAIAAMVVAVLVGLTLGVMAAAMRGRLLDRAVTGFASLMVAIPPFWLGLMLVIFFALDRSWFPAVGYVGITENPVLWLKHITLPAVTLGLGPAAEISRQLRTALCDELDKEYLRTARAKGVRRAPALM